MKRMKALLLLLAVAGAASVAMAYEPIVKENKQWVYYEWTSQYGSGEMTFYPTVYEFRGDTVIQGKQYHKLWEDRYMFNIQTKEFDHSVEVVAYVRESQGTFSVTGTSYHYVYARRVGSYQPLTGMFSSEDEDGAEYIVYQFGRSMTDFYYTVLMTELQRNNLFDFTKEYQTFVDDNGTERVCWPTSLEQRKIIEGIGYVITNTGGNQYFVQNFIDLEARRDMMRIFSHLIVNGKITFKGDAYDFIHEHEIYAPEGGGDVPSGVSELPVDGGAAAGGRTYDLQGRAVNDPLSPGIYIRDGQKLLVE